MSANPINLPSNIIMINKKIACFYMFLGLSMNSAFAAPTLADFENSFQEHRQYVLQMLQVFMDSRQVQNQVKVAVATQLDALEMNTAITVAYESMILNTKGEVCKGEVADRIPAVLEVTAGSRAPVMFKAGNIQYVNIDFFRDLCITYKRDPERVSDLYVQQMTQIKSTTGGRRYDDMHKKPARTPANNATYPR